jgi:hypothetical protein
MATRNFDTLLDSCIVCDGGNIVPKLVDFRGISIWQCGDCDFQFMNPQYSDADLYDTDHHVLYFSPETLGRLLAKHGLDVVFSRNGHVAKPNQTKFKRWRLKYLLEPLYPRSGFFVLVRKRPA